MKTETVLVLGGYDRSLLNFRGPLLRAMVQAGHTVVGAAPAETSGVPDKLAGMGVRFVPVALARAGLDPLADVMTLFRLKAHFQRERPDVVLSYTIKPAIYGSLAARWVRVSRIYALITGLGAAFYTPGLKGRLLRFMAVAMYRVALSRCTKVLVQNREIADLFIREGIVLAGRVVVVSGSGVDTKYFSLCPGPKGPPVFLLLARMLRDKGVEEYVSAAGLIKKQLFQARFLLVGDTDPNPAAISRDQLDEWNRDGVVEYRPGVSDVRPLLAACSVYVLPSYHEGMPRSVLEAMATGRPVITTDTIGCRETVISGGPPDSEGIRTGDNGLLVPVRSVAPLAAAMLRLASDACLREKMGRRGREIAEQKFDVRKINDQMLRAMELLPSGNDIPSGISSF
jgi:glycosyltransferase involved in cell wall biosynthesis